MLKIVNPATEAVIREIGEDTPETIAAKFKRACAAQKAWARAPLAGKIEAIGKFKGLLAKNIDKLAATLTSEMGKPITQARNEVNGVAGRIDFFVENVARVLDEKKVLTDAAQKLEEAITHEPLGVIGNISAWNYPYFVGSNVFVPALLTGNAVLYKPSEFATLTGLAITELLYEAGIAEDVFIPVIGGASVGAMVLEMPLNGVFFTGSYATGRKIAAAVADRMIKLQLELGGKDPVYVCNDVDVQAAAEATADGAFYNTGQSCCSVERIYVHEKIHDRFVDAFAKTVEGFTIGDPADQKTYIGALTRPLQIEVLDRQVADAKKRGGRLLTGGERAARKGHFYRPTVFADADHSMELMREESFGPIIGIQKVKSDEEAVSLMNDTAYGLTAAVYTKDRARARKVLAQANAGTVYWNCCDRVSPRLPWSGRGHSGIGSTLSTYGIETFLQLKAWHLKG